MLDPVLSWVFTASLILADCLMLFDRYNRRRLKLECRRQDAILRQITEITESIEIN